MYLGNSNFALNVPLLSPSIPSGFLSCAGAKPHWEIFALAANIWLVMSVLLKKDKQ